MLHILDSYRLLILMQKLLLRLYSGLFETLKLFFVYYLAGSSVLATPLLMSHIFYFWQMSGSCCSRQARYHLSHPCPLATLFPLWNSLHGIAQQNFCFFKIVKHITTIIFLRKGQNQYTLTPTHTASPSPSLLLRTCPSHTRSSDLHICHRSQRNIYLN
jgi:hypothetical protein